MEVPQQPGGPVGPETPPGAPGLPPAGYPPPQPPGGYPPPPQAPAPPRVPGTYRGQELASWGSRVGAQLLDGLVVTAVGLALCVPGGIVAIVTEGGVAGWVLLGVGGLGWIVLGALYAPFLMRRAGDRNGQTLGKQWLGIRVVRDDGTPIGWGWAFLRELVIKGFGLGVASSIASTITFFLFGLGGFIPYALDYLWPLWDDESRAVHDMAAQTHVVQA